MIDVIIIPTLTFVPPATKCSRSSPIRLEQRARDLPACIRDSKESSKVDAERRVQNLVEKRSAELCPSVRVRTENWDEKEKK